MRIGYPHLSTAGRLGNQLWEIAATIGLARRDGREPWFPTWDYQPFFNVPAEYFADVSPEPFMDAITMVPHMDRRAAPYLQDYSLFADVTDEIKEYFKPSDLAVEQLVGIWNDSGLGDYDAVCSLHVRRGDNVTHPVGFHPLRSMQYYRDALSHIPDGVQVAVFTDDPDWCEEHLAGELRRHVAYIHRGVARPREYIDRQEYLDAPILDWIDLQLMAACDYHIISNSTYAWWGAFLSQDPAPIYPCAESWFGTEIAPWTDASLMFPSLWHPVHDLTEGGSVDHMH